MQQQLEFNNPKLSEKEVEILKLEKRCRELYNQFARLPNNEERAKLYSKYKELSDKKRGMLYAAGTVAEEHEHLLTEDGELDLSLLKDI